MHRADVSAATLGVLLSLFLPAASVWAADESVEGRIEHDAAIDAAIRRTSEQSRTAPAHGETATYEQVLEDPDNVELNVRYAKTQVARGDLKGAAATLERILLIQPAHLRAQLFYGVVLYQLGNLPESERVLTELRGKPMAASLRSEIDEYLDRIRLRQRTTRFSTSLSLGYGIDDNRNASPSSKKRILSDIEFPVTGTARKRRDTNFLALYNLSVAQDLGFQAGHELFGSFDYYLGEQTVVDDLDLQSFDATVGGVLKTPWAQVIPRLSSGALLLDRETFLRTDSIGVQARRALNKRLGITADSRWAHEDYNGIFQNATAPERKGDRWTVGAGANVLLNSAMQLEAEITFDMKDAKAAYQAYDGVEVDWTHTWLLGHGQFLISSLSHALNSYEERDPAISSRTRQDKHLRARATYGLPVSLLTGSHLPEMLTKDLTATMSIEHFRSLSKIQNYTYSDSKWTLLFTKTLEF